MITKEKIIETIKGMNLYIQPVSDYLESDEFTLTEETILKFISTGVLHDASQRQFIKDNYSQLVALGKLDASGKILDI
jgi:hypothetical protein